MVNEQQLTAASGSGTQSATQDPQTASQSNGLATTSGNVQTSVTSSVLESQTGGIPLYSTPVPTLNLNQTIPGTTYSPPSSAHHTPNPVLLGFAGLLVVVAVVLFWTTSRSAKNTTK